MLRLHRRLLSNMAMQLAYQQQDDATVDVGYAIGAIQLLFNYAIDSRHRPLQENSGRWADIHSSPSLS